MSDLKQNRGRVTIPTDVDVVPETLELLERWGADAIRERADLVRLHGRGAQAFLIGETLMRAPSHGRKLCELLSK